MGLLQKTVDESSFTVVDMSNNSNVSDSVFVHNLAIISQITYIVNRGIIDKKRNLWYN